MTESDQSRVVMGSNAKVVFGQPKFFCSNFQKFGLGHVPYRTRTKFEPGPNLACSNPITSLELEPIYRRFPINTERGFFVNLMFLDPIKSQRIVLRIDQK